MIGLKDLGLPEWFTRTPAGKQIVEQHQAEVAGQRRHALEVVATVQKERDAVMPRLLVATGAARKRLADAKLAVVQAQRDLAAAEVAEMTAQHRYQSEIATHRAFLHQTAPALVNEYLAELLSFYSAIRHPNVVVPDLPAASDGLESLGDQQRKALAARWEQTRLALEFHELVRNTITLVKRMLAESWTENEAAREIEAHRRCIAKAQQRAGISLN